MSDGYTITDFSQWYQWALSQRQDDGPEARLTALGIAMREAPQPHASQLMLAALCSRQAQIEPNEWSAGDPPKYPPDLSASQQMDVFMSWAVQDKMLEDASRTIVDAAISHATAIDHVVAKSERAPRPPSLPLLSRCIITDLLGLPRSAAPDKTWFDEDLSDDADWWAWAASPHELRVYMAAIWRAMSQDDRVAFLAVARV